MNVVELGWVLVADHEDHVAMWILLASLLALEFDNAIAEDLAADQAEDEWRAMLRLVVALLVLLEKDRSLFLAQPPGVRVREDKFFHGVRLGELGGVKELVVCWNSGRIVGGTRRQNSSEAEQR